MTRSESVTDDAADSRDDELVGRAFGKYTLARVIGRGGMGVVYEALNTAIGKRVAIKLITAELARNKDAVRRFQREAQAASAVESAHIVDIFDAGMNDEGIPYLVMELLRGEDLGHRIKRLGRLELDEALHVTVQILRGLARAHAAGIVHRDLKPDNVFLVDRDDDSTFVKILDFGISKVARSGDVPVQTLTKQGTVLGTPFYMSPEQAQGLPDTDGRADLWSAGAILYECLTGRAPHTGASYEQVIVNICTKDAADVRAHNPGVPEPMAKAISKSLAREREERFASARDMLEGLAAASGGLIVLSPRTSDDPGAQSGGARSGPGSSPSGDRARVISGGVAKAASGDVARASGGSSRDSGAGARPGGSAFEDTVEVLKGGGPSRVGWSTSGGPAARRDRKVMLYVGLGALLAGALGAAAFAMRGPSDHPIKTGEALAGPAGQGDVTVRLRANVGGARFLVDGRQLAGGLLRGPKGETKKVLVEADGHVPVEAVVLLDPGQELPEIELRPLVAAGAAASGTGPAPTAVAMETGVPRNGTRPGAKPSASPSSKPSALPSSAPADVTVQLPPVPTVTPAPTPTLTIKRD